MNHGFYPPPIYKPYRKREEIPRKPEEKKQKEAGLSNTGKYAGEQERSNGGGSKSNRKFDHPTMRHIDHRQALP